MGSIFKSKPSSEDHQQVSSLLGKYPDMWEYLSCQGPNHCTSSSGVIMDEPYASERAEVTLVQPAAIEDGGESTSCYVDIDSSHLRGYFLAAIELISSSRTVELYSSPNQDYIGTSRGSLMEKREE